jgi:hypothetical protein
MYMEIFMVSSDVSLIAGYSGIEPRDYIRYSAPVP